MCHAGNCISQSHALQQYCHGSVTITTLPACLPAAGTGGSRPGMLSKTRTSAILARILQPNRGLIQSLRGGTSCVRVFCCTFCLSSSSLRLVKQDKHMHVATLQRGHLHLSLQVRSCETVRLLLEERALEPGYAGLREENISAAYIQASIAVSGHQIPKPELGYPPYVTPSLLAAFPRCSVASSTADHNIR